MKPPLVVDGRGELLFFPSADAAGRYIEEIDVRNGEYGSCWDAEGRPLSLGIEPVARSLFGILKWSIRGVVVQQENDQPTQSAQLRLALVDFLAASHGSREELASKSLSELVELGAARAGLS